MSSLICRAQAHIMLSENTINEKHSLQRKKKTEG